MEPARFFKISQVFSSVTEPAEGPGSAQQLIFGDDGAWGMDLMPPQRDLQTLEIGLQGVNQIRVVQTGKC